MPLRRYRVTMKSGTTYEVEADSADDARMKALAKLRARLGGGVMVTPGASPHHRISSVERADPERSRGGKFHPFGIGSPDYNRRHNVNPRTGMPRK